MKHFYKHWLHEQQIFTRMTFFKWSTYVSLEISLQDVERLNICIEGHGKANKEVSSKVSEHTLHALIEQESITELYMCTYGCEWDTLCIVIGVQAQYSNGCLGY